MSSGLRVLPVLALPAAIEDSIRKYYGGTGTNGSATTVAAAPSTKAAEAAQISGNFNTDIRSAIASAQIARPTKDDVEDNQADAEQMADQAPIIRLANALIQQGIADRASDIHVEPMQKSVRIRYRVDGVLQEAMTVPRNLMAAMISRLKIMADMNIAERRIPQDGRIEVRNPLFVSLNVAIGCGCRHAFRVGKTGHGLGGKHVNRPPRHSRFAAEVGLRFRDFF